MFLVKLLGIVKTVQDVLAVITPALELLVKRDMNGDGKIG